MRTLTIDVPDVVVEIARRQGRPAEEVVRQALAEWADEVLADAEDRRVASERWATLQSGAVEAEDWDAVKDQLGAGGRDASEVAASLSAPTSEVEHPLHKVRPADAHLGDHLRGAPAYHPGISRPHL